MHELDKPRILDETNVARLGLISIQNRLPSGYNTWRVDFTLSEKPAYLSCEGLDKLGVPHGIDNDVSVALIALYQEQGASEDGIVVCNIRQIMRLMDLPESAQYYESVRESLERLNKSTYTISGAWQQSNQYITVTFRFIDKLRYSSEQIGKLTQSSRFEIKLAEEVTRSIRERNLKPIDLGFMTSLRNPQTRALYRLLDAQRLGPGGQMLQQLQLDLLSWAQACKIVDTEANRIKRILAGPHEELLTKGYLSRIEYVGRGKTSSILYVFGTVTHLDELTVRLLVEEGLSLRAAQLVAQQYSRSHVEERILIYRAILGNGYSPRNKQGLLVDILNDKEGRYAANMALPRSKRKKAEAGSVQQSTGSREAGAVQEPEPVEETWAHMPKPEQVDRAMKALNLLLKGQFNPAEMSLLEERLGVDFDPRKLVAEGSQAMAQRKVGEWAQGLREMLG
jgi:plasmid replication initiation protein